MLFYIQFIVKCSQLGQQDEQERSRSSHPAAAAAQGPLLQEAIRKQQQRHKIKEEKKTSIKILTREQGGEKQAGKEEQEEAAAVQRILKDSELRALLLDPEMQVIMQECSRGGQSLARHMCNPEIAEKLRRLAAAGLLTVEQ